MSDEMLELAERCEQATGPDYAIDAAIWRELTPEHERWFFGTIGDVDECWLWGNPSTDRDWDKSPPAFTASLDAAMPIVPEGWRWCRYTHARPDEPCDVTLIEPGQISGGRAATPALALCAAALRARAQGSSQ